MGTASVLPCLPINVLDRCPPLTREWWQRYRELVAGGYPPVSAEEAARGTVPVVELLRVEREEEVDGE